MISYYLFIKLKPTPREDIVTRVEPRKEVNKLDFTESYLKNYCEFQLLDTDHEQEIFELCSGEHYNGYPQNTLDDFRGISHLIDRTIVCRLYGEEEFMNIKVYDMKENPNQVNDYVGVRGARGYDAINAVEEDYNIELGWDWDELSTTVRTALNI